MRREEAKAKFSAFRQDLSREFWLLMSEKKLIVPYLSVVAGLVVIFISVSVILNSSTSKLLDEQASLYTENEKLLSEITRYNVNYLQQILTREFDKEDTNKRINSNFTYNLYINSSEITESTNYSNQDKITIELYESVPKSLTSTYSESLIGDASLIKDGKLPGNYIRVSCGSKEAESKLIKSGLDSRLQLSFSGLNSGDIITIELTYSFAERLGLENNIIEIIKR